MFLPIVTRSIIGAVVGFVVGKLWIKLAEIHEDRQLKRIMRMSDETIERSFVTLHKLEEKRQF